MENTPLLPQENDKSKYHKFNIVSIVLFVFVMGIILVYHIVSGSISTTESIRGGKDAEGTDYPWIASWRDSENNHCCVGSLINKNPAIILTAGQCISLCGKDTMVDLGRTNKLGTDSNKETFQIDFITKHPDFDAKESWEGGYDAAMVVLQGSTDREPINLVLPKLGSRDLFAEGTPVEILGYGDKNLYNTYPSSTLQYGLTSYWNKDQCKDALKNKCSSGQYWQREQMFCVYNDETAFQDGDEGGPAVMHELLAGIASWVPNKCQDFTYVGVFTDVGSIRHWIEDAKATQETYILAVHTCDDPAAETRGEVYVTLQSRKRKTSLLLSESNSDLDVVLQRDQFSVFRFEIDNIGWDVESVSFQVKKKGNPDPFCVDFVVAGRMDAPQLFAGASEIVWVESKQSEIALFDYCKYIPETSTEVVQNKREHHYTIIIHICAETFADSSAVFYAKLHGSADSSEWFVLTNVMTDQQSLDIDGVYIFDIDIGDNIGNDIASVEFQAVGAGELCIDTISAGRAYDPYYWKGSTERFWLDYPCQISDSINPCYQFHTVYLDCYY